MHLTIYKTFDLPFPYFFHKLPSLFHIYLKNNYSDLATDH